MTLSEELNALPLSWDRSGTYGLRPGYALEVNDYGCQLVEHTLTAHTDREYSKVGFQWAIPLPSGGVMMYPEIIHGRKPWASHSTTEALPKRLSELAKVRAQFAYRVDAAGKFNVALESWLLSSADAGPEGIVGEVMWWVRSEGGCLPAGRREATFTDQFGTVWEVWKDSTNVSRPWPYYAFVSNRVGQVDVLGSIKSLGIDGDPWLATIEAGAELWSGQGRMIFDLFNVEIE